MGHPGVPVHMQARPTKIELEQVTEIKTGTMKTSADKTQQLLR